MSKGKEGHKKKSPNSKKYLETYNDYQKEKKYNREEFRVDVEYDIEPLIVNQYLGLIATPSMNYKIKREILLLK